jgi:hypothetical protein
VGGLVVAGKYNAYQRMVLGLSSSALLEDMTNVTFSVKEKLKYCFRFF